MHTKSAGRIGGRTPEPAGPQGPNARRESTESSGLFRRLMAINQTDGVTA